MLVTVQHPWFVILHSFWNKTSAFMKMQWSAMHFNGISEENLSFYIDELIHLPCHLQWSEQLRYEHREILVHFLTIFPSIFLRAAMSGPVLKQLVIHLPALLRGDHYLPEENSNGRNQSAAPGGRSRKDLDGCSLCLNHTSSWCRPPQLMLRAKQDTSVRTSSPSASHVPCPGMACRNRFISSFGEHEKSSWPHGNRMQLRVNAWCCFLGLLHANPRGKSAALNAIPCQSSSKQRSLNMRGHHCCYITISSYISFFFLLLVRERKRKIWVNVHSYAVCTFSPCLFSISAFLSRVYPYQSCQFHAISLILLHAIGKMICY